MILELLDAEFTVCQVRSLTPEDLRGDFAFVGKTDEELSLVCRTGLAPSGERLIAREDGWRAFRIVGVLDFSLVGILSGIAGVLAAEKIGIFAVSTYNTDYILVKKENAARADAALRAAGYETAGAAPEDENEAG